MIPESIAGYIDMWRNDIAAANMMTIDHHIKRASEHRGNILYLIDDDAEIMRLLNGTVEASSAYYLSAVSFRAGDESLKQEALQCIEALASELRYAKPNQIARSNGQDWFITPRE